MEKTSTFILRECWVGVVIIAWRGRCVEAGGGGWRWGGGGGGARRGLFYVSERHLKMIVS